MTNANRFSFASMITLAKAHEGEGHGKAHEEAPKDKAPEAGPEGREITVAGVTFELPMKWAVGFIMDNALWEIANAHVQGQFRNNLNARYEAWKKRHAKWLADGSKGEEPPNPCTVEKMLEEYVDYMPTVGKASKSLIERQTEEAHARTVVSMIDEHNASVAAGTGGKYGYPAETLAHFKGKDRDAMIERVSKTQHPAVLALVAKHLEDIKAEAGKEQPKAATKLNLAEAKLDF